MQCEVAFGVHVEQGVPRHFGAQHKLLDSVRVAAEQYVQTPARSKKMVCSQFVKLSWLL